MEVNAAPGEDLTKILNDLRNEYEQIIEKNRREVEQWYEVKVRSNAEVKAPIIFLAQQGGDTKEKAAVGRAAGQV